MKAILLALILLVGSYTAEGNMAHDKTILMGEDAPAPKKVGALQKLVDNTSIRKLGTRTKITKSLSMDLKLKKRQPSDYYSKSKVLGGNRGRGSSNETTPYLGFEFRF